MTEFSKGHRQRLRSRFLKGGMDAVNDYEILELLLYAANPRKDMKPLAKHLIQSLGSFSDVLLADAQSLKKIEGVTEGVITSIKIAHAASCRIFHDSAKSSQIIDSWQGLLKYCKAQMSGLRVEQLRLIFLDKRHRVLRDEVQHEGTIDHTPIYPREVIRRALELDASAFIMVHNHPSGDPTPSRADIEATKHILQVCENLGILLYDHLVIGRNEHVSFRQEGFL